MVISQIPDDTLSEFFSNNSMLEPFWSALDGIGDVGDGKQLLNSTIMNITQTFKENVDKEDIRDFISNKTLNERINQGKIVFFEISSQKNNKFLMNKITSCDVLSL